LVEKKLSSIIAKHKCKPAAPTPTIA